MAYKTEKIRNNIFVMDVPEIEAPDFKGDYCFIIGHHCKNYDIIFSKPLKKF